MDVTLDNLDQRLRILEDPSRLRWTETPHRSSPEADDWRNGRCDVLRLRWHTEGEGGLRTAVPAGTAAQTRD